MQAGVVRALGFSAHPPEPDLERNERQRCGKEFDKVLERHGFGMHEMEGFAWRRFLSGKTTNCRRSVL